MSLKTCKNRPFDKGVKIPMMFPFPIFIHINSNKVARLSEARIVTIRRVIICSLVVKNNNKKVKIKNKNKKIYKK